MTHHTIIVLDIYNGMRLDKFLRMQLKDYHWSQSFIEKALRDKKIKIDGRKSASSDRLSTGMIVNIKQVPSSYIVQKERHLHNEAKDLKQYILFEDDHIIALNKPCGLACQGGTRIAVSLDDILKCIDPNIRLVHRLDKKTSGLLIVAKNLKAAQKLTGYFTFGLVCIVIHR
jgi:23S rRNA pseudouridine955/2504/2580 synthase